MADHCTGGTEDECIQGCKDQCEQAKRDHNWQARCDEARQVQPRECAKARNNPPARGHWCSRDGDGYKAAKAAEGHWCSESGGGRRGAQDAIGDKCSGNSWDGCLAACGGQKACRVEWGDGGNKRNECLGLARASYDACMGQCSDVPSPAGCGDEYCVGFARLVDCNGATRVTGFCLGWTWKL